MRPIESIALIALALAVVAQALGAGAARARRALAGATAGALVLSAALEGARWQLVPAYVLAAALVALAARRAAARPPGGIRRVLRVAAALVALAISLALPAILPVPSLPPADGPYPVGTVTFVLEDPSRDEAATPGHRRRVTAQAWYPADASAARAPRAPYMPDAKRIGPALAGAIGLPGFFADHLALASADAHEGAPFAPSIGRAPLVVYSHGLGTVRALGTSTALALASRGYVVVAIDHTGDAAAVAFPDGVVALRSFRIPDEATDEEADRLKASWVRIRAADVRLLLDALARDGDGPIPAPIRGHADAARAGVAGHSLGGSTAIEVCRTDPRAAACVDLDGTAYGDAVDATLAQPLLRTSSDLEGPSDRMDARTRVLAALDARARGPACLVHVVGSRHGDFTDMAALSPLLPYLTPIVAKRGREETLRGTNEVVAAFFDATLRADAAAWSRVTAPRPRFETACQRLPAR